MELMQALFTRRSVRKYKNTMVPKQTLQKLLEAATLAPSASNSQPWSFVIIQDHQLLKEFSDKAKPLCLASLENEPDPYNYQKILADPGFNIFYNAGTLVIIYGNKGATAYGDCCLAAQNLMLAAHAEGLGTCWIGFSVAFFNDKDLKLKLGIDPDLTAVAPIIIGYPEFMPSAHARKLPQILAWK